MPKPLNLTVVIPHRPTESVEPILSRLKKTLGTKIRYQVVCVTGNQPSVQRNLAVRKSRGEIIYFIDNDSYVTSGSVELALSLFRKDPRIAVVGGPSLTPKSDTFIQKCFGLVLSSLFAVGLKIRSRYKAVGRPRLTGEFELILCNMFVRREVFAKAGGFDERLYPNEENAFINTVKGMGYKVYYHPAISVEREQRKGISQFIRQMFTYGRGRADQFFLQPSSFSLFLLVPVLFTLYVAAFFPVLFLLPAGALRWAWLSAAGLYLALDFLFSAMSSVESRHPAVLAVVPLLFLLVHFFYGFGMITGTIRNLAGGSKKKTVKPRARIDHESGN